MKTIGRWLTKAWCFLRGHDWITIKLDDSDIFDGRWQSAFGEHICMRCGKLVPWQYDR
jgi:hypothetical protein